MIRKAEKALITWRERKKYKPLLLTGARQVGKTWLMKNLGAMHFENFIYINFEKEQAFRNLFQTDLNINRIVQTLALMSW
jgi:predicted AAA+ superfamily ATPase